MHEVHNKVLPGYLDLLRYEPCGQQPCVDKCKRQAHFANAHWTTQCNPDTPLPMQPPVMDSLTDRSIHPISQNKTSEDHEPDLTTSQGEAWIGFG